MIYKYVSRLSLLARFTLASFIVTLLIAVGLASRLEHALEQDVFAAVAENTAHQASNSLNQSLTTADLGSAISGVRYDEVDTLIHNTLLSNDIVRIKIWNREGRLVYSDNKESVGRVFELEEDQLEAFEGNVLVEVTNLDAAENIAERGQYQTLLEIYVPLTPADSEEILGAYEVYYDLSQLEPRLTRLRYTVWGGVGIAFLILYGSLFLIVRNGSRELIQRNWENRILLLKEDGERERSERLERISRALREILDLRHLLDLICHESADLFKTHAAFLWLLEEGELVGFAAYGPGADTFIGMRVPIYDPQLLGARVTRERKPILVNYPGNSLDADPKLTERFPARSMMGIPLIKGTRILGALMILDTEHPYRFNAQDLEMASVLGGHAALAIDNAQLYEKAQLHLKHERALREIDLAITSNMELD